MAKMSHGDAERMYDWCVLLGLNPVPWQFELLRTLEQRSIDEQFAELIRDQSRRQSPPRGDRPRVAPPPPLG